MPAKGLKYQASPAQKKNAALAARSTCNSFLSRFCSGMRARTWVCARVVASTPATMTIAACRRAFLESGCVVVAVAMAGLHPTGARLGLSNAISDTRRARPLRSVARQLLAVLLQEVVDGFYADAQRARGFVLVDIAEAEVGFSGALGDLFDDAADEGVMAAFEVRQFDRNQVGMARGELGGPEFMVGSRRAGDLPDIGHRKRGSDQALRHFGPEETLEQVFVQRQVGLRKDRIAELLQRIQYSLVQARIVMIGTAEQDQADLVLPLQFVQQPA